MASISYRKEISNTYGIKVSPSFIQKIRSIKERKLAPIKRFIDTKLAKIRPANPDLVIIKQKVDSLKENTNWSFDIQPFLPAFEGIMTEREWIDNVNTGNFKVGKVYPIADQYPYLIWKLEQWKLYNTFIIYMYAKGYFLNDNLLLQDKAKLINYLEIIPDIIRNEKPELYEQYAYGRKININLIYEFFTFLPTMYPVNLMKKYLEKKK